MRHSLKSLRLEAVATRLDGSKYSAEILKSHFESEAIWLLLPPAILCPRGGCSLAGCWALFKEHRIWPLTHMHWGTNPWLSFLERRLL